MEKTVKWVLLERSYNAKIDSLIPFEAQESCLSDRLRYGRIRSAIVTAARAFTLEDTVL